MYRFDKGLHEYSDKYVIANSPYSESSVIKMEELASFKVKFWPKLTISTLRDIYSYSENFDLNHGKLRSDYLSLVIKYQYLDEKTGKEPNWNFEKLTLEDGESESDGNYLCRNEILG